MQLAQNYFVDSEQGLAQFDDLVFLDCDPLLQAADDQVWELLLDGFLRDPERQMSHLDICCFNQLKVHLLGLLLPPERELETPDQFVRLGKFVVQEGQT